jgi:hypothetical protein
MNGCAGVINGDNTSMHMAVSRQVLRDGEPGVT